MMSAQKGKDVSNFNLSYGRIKLECLNVPKNHIDLTYQLYRLVGSNLKKLGRISIDGDKFAKYCTILSYCESNLDPEAVSNGQQGICQFTRLTRQKLNIPDDIRKASISDQILYHERYFLGCDKRLLKKVNTPEDLHFLNFKPFGKRYIHATRNTSNLDFNKDGWITPADLKKFQLKRIKENSVISKMYDSLNETN